MSVRGKLLAAQAPLALAIVVVGVVAGTTNASLGANAARVLRENYRSVMAAERMKEAAFAGEGARFQTELAVAEHNVTEPGEAEAIAAVRVAWERGDLPAVRAATDHILEINQDAMVRKSDRALVSATRATSLTVAVAVAACLLGLLASITLTTRIIRPLSVLGQTARRIGAGDLVVRAQVSAKDEIGELSKEFNAMAAHLEQYRKSSLGELLSAQSAAQAVIDSLPDPVIVVGVRGELLNVNRTAELQLGLRVEDGLASLDPALRPVVETLAAHVVGGHGAYVPRGMDEAIRAGELHYLPRATPVYAQEGGISGTTVVLQDVTRLLRFDELKTNLVATVAHEFRTPLTSLRMAIHMCVEGAVGDLNAKQLDMLVVAREDCERLQTIVDDLLDMSRLQSGHVDISPREVTAEALVHDAVAAHQAAARHAGVSLRGEVMPGLATLMADPDRLQLVLANLVTNAVRHTPPHGEVIVRALPAESAVRLEVQDSGPGIPAEHRAAIFDKFYRVPGAPGGGAGLGLYLAKEIVIAHGGTIGVDAAPTTFWLTLPLAA